MIETYGSQMRLIDHTFSDIEDLCEVVRPWNLDVRPLAHPIHDGPAARIVQSRIGDFEFLHARIRSSIDQFGQPPGGLFAFSVLEPTIRRLWWRGHDVGSETVLVFPTGCELRCVSGPDFENHTISVAEETVRRICDELEFDWPSKRRHREVFTPPLAMLHNIRLMLRIFRDCEHAGSVIGASTVVQDLVAAWMNANGEVRDRRPKLRVRDRAIRQSMELLEENCGAELSPAMLRKYCRVSERTLQYAFRERFGLTPAAFLKARRLATVRSRLRRGNLECDTVAGIATRFGFWHVGQFASDYRRAYGELPSDTLRKS